MSKIGQVYLAMDEALEKTGYHDVHEAMADGWDSAEYYSMLEESE